MNVATREEGLQIDLTYWTSKLSSGQAVHLANTYSTVIMELLSNPETVLADVNMLSPLDKESLRDWNKELPFAVDRCMHEVIHQNARERPHALALESWEAAYTYRDLDRASSRLARHLIKQGVSPDDCIPLCFEKSLYTVIALVAVLKAGGGFVLLDPKHPDDRLKGLLEDSKARFLIVSPQTQDRCKDLISSLVVVSPKILDELPHADEDDTPPLTAVTPENIMYVQFTSGSTGKPKGAVVHHRAACSSIEHHGKVMNYGPDSRIFQFSSYTFDAIILEAFTTLYHGGCVCIPSEEDRMSSMVQSMREMKVNNMFMTPTLARLFGPADVPSLTTLMLGGEPIPQDSINTWRDHVDLIGGYGPAECCVYCCYNPLSSSGFKPEVIGYPVGAVLWIVEADNHDRLVPVGAIGEIVVHGHTVGRGYLNDPARTAASYISAPSWIADYGYTGEQTLYKTGDLGRYNSDGTLTIVGRKDTQVKVNGQRIELGEVEHCIKTEYPQVLQVAVDALKPEHANGRQILSAFLEFEADEGSEEFQDENSFLRAMNDKLRETMFEIEAILAQRLPPYMVPHLWFPLVTMPKSASGKTDRKVLKQLCNGLSKAELQQYSLASGSKKALETPMEERIAGLWKDLFGVSNIGSNDNFFRVGGDSIEAMKLAAAARAQGLSLSVADIFNNPKLDDMARIVVAADGASAVAHKYDAPFSLVGGEESARSIVQKHLPHVQIDLVEDVYPSTSLQEGLLALTSGQSRAYVLQAPFLLPPNIDLGRFRDAWAKVVEANAILRTVIISTETQGTCQVALRQSIEWSQASTLEEYLAQDREKPMGYGTPLSRYGLTSDGYFVWTAHHSIYDGWSFALMLDEVEKRYKDESVVSRPVFAEYIRFLQRQQGKTDATAFWKSQLQDASSSSAFPQLPSSLYEVDVDRTFKYSFPFRTKSTVTASTLLSAAWGLTIGRLTNSSEVIYGSTRSGRNIDLAQATELMGPTIATVPIRISIDPSMSVEDFLAAVQNQATAAIPFEHLGLQNISKISPACKAACDFQNLFVVQPAMIGDYTILGMKRVELPTKGLHTYALNVECILTEDGTATLNFEYDGKVMQDYQIQRLAGQFHHIVCQLCENEGGRLTVADVDAFSVDDEKQLRGWNARLKSFPEITRCAHDLVSERARLHPELLAVTQSDGTSLTYGELENLSTLFARHLSTLEIGPGRIVPICLKKAVWVVVSMLGVLKTGAAFVCLDPSSPSSRMHSIIEDVESELVIVDPETKPIFSSHLQTLEIGANSLDWIRSASASDIIFEVHRNPRDLMYVIFTSGSTGKPKGVMIEHASACSSFTYQGEEFGYDHGSRVLQFSALTFDASLMEIFTTLCAGGCVCFPTEEEKQGDIVRAINNLRVNSVMLTPTVLRMIQPEDIPMVKHVVTGGEAVSHDIVQTWSSKVILKGVYGPTETSMICITADLVPGSSPANIGVPLGCRTWITLPDDHNQLAPIGSVGELLIQGSIVGRGYYKNQKQTQEVFIENPRWLQKRFGETGGGRLYKTGDLVYYAQNGNLMIVGRKDSQVKLHGQRIELGEIDHKMWSHPAVRQSSVVLPSQGPLKNRLVAVLTLDGTEEQITAPDVLRPLSEECKQYANSQIVSIRQALRESLPSYMVPTVFVAVEKMPRQTSGKTDIKRVKKWVNELNEQTAEQVLDIETTAPGLTVPGSETEKVIQGAVSKVLNIPAEKIALNRSFISLGGDSITAIKLMNQLRDAGMNFSIKELLRAGSIGELASVVTSINEGENANPLSSHVPQKKEKKYPLLCLEDTEIETLLAQRLATIGITDLTQVEDVYPCSPLQEGLLLAQTKGVGSYNVYNIYEVTTSKHSSVSVNPHLLAKAWDEVVRRHQILRTIFIQGLEESTAFNQVVLREVHNTPFVIEDAKRNDAKALLQNLATPEYPAFDPWHSVTICSDANGTVCCGIRMHHALFDASSMDIILREVAQAYNQSLSTPAPLYRDYISYLQGLQQGGNDALAYWQEYLKDLEPCYFPSINEQALGTRTPQSLQFNVPGLSQILLFSTRKNVTVSTILQTAWALVLRHYTSTEEICFGYLSHGRDIPLDGIDNIVGPMINMMVLRVTLSGNRTLTDILEGTRDDVLNSLPHQHTSLAEIHHALDLQGRSAFNTTLSFASAAADAENDDGVAFKNLSGSGSTEVGRYTIKHPFFDMMC